MPARHRLAFAGLLSCGFLFAGIAFLGQYPPCDGYPAWETSAYVLPYPVGESHILHQGNCSAGGHHAAFRYSYDFLMPIGSSVTAARAGVVVEVMDGYQDGNGTSENWVKVRHVDGTIAAYSHLHSLSAHIGDELQQGSPIGLSGNTGKTGGVPHLHFHISACSEPVNCGTIAVTFRNISPNPGGLQFHQEYVAEPYAP